MLWHPHSMQSFKSTPLSRKKSNKKLNPITSSTVSNGLSSDICSCWYFFTFNTTYYSGRYCDISEKPTWAWPSEWHCCQHPLSGVHRSAGYPQFGWTWRPPRWPNSQSPLTLRTQGCTSWPGERTGEYYPQIPFFLIWFTVLIGLSTLTQH